MATVALGVAMGGAWFLAGPVGSDVAALVGRALDASAAWIDANPLVAAVVFIASSAAARLFPIPAGAMMTVTGGYVFGTVAGAALAAAGAATAAALVFVIGRPLLAGIVRRRLGHRLAAIEHEVAAGAFNYLLALRILPVIPAWLVNLLPLAFPIPVHTVILATFLGLLPISLMFAGLGSGLATLGSTPVQTFTDGLLRWELFLPLMALAGLALLPVVFRHLAPKGWFRLPGASGLQGSSEADPGPPLRLPHQRLR
jgi:uncharacterized membrane protein YdjX (TVP38/TMEM64 family)